MARVFRIILWTAGAILVFTGLIIFFSPFGKHPSFAYKVVKTKIVINKPVNEVFDYLGDSDNAAKWSVFVDHITQLNADSFADGEIGSRRRVFCNADETGQRWDELISAKKLHKMRQLELYNYVDFPITATHLATEQLYESLPDNKTQLTFTVFYKDYDPTYFELFKTYLAAYKIQDIFEQNMANIKQFVEAGQ